MRYWVEGLSAPDWEQLAGKDPLQECPSYDGLYGLTVPAGRGSEGGEDTPKEVFIAAAGRPVAAGNRKREILFLLSARLAAGRLLPPENALPVLLNPRYFPRTEGEVDDHTVAMAGAIYEAMEGLDCSSWVSYLDSVAAAFSGASLDVRRLTGPGGVPLAVVWRVLEEQAVSRPAEAILDAYRRLLLRPFEAWPELFRRIVAQEAGKDEPGPPAGILAHVDAAREPHREVRALDPVQRQAARRALALGESELLAVHGPPGTGKTTFVRALIASWWVRPLLEEEALRARPPLVVGTSTSNAAVDNILKALAEAAGPAVDEPRRVSDRFIPGLASYGWLLPARSRQLRVERQYLSLEGGVVEYRNCGEELAALTGGRSGGRSRAAVLRSLEDRYIAAAARVFGRPFGSVEDVVEWAAGLLRGLAAHVAQGRAAVEALVSAPREQQVAEVLRERARALEERRGRGARAVAARVELLLRRWQLRQALRRLDALREGQAAALRRRLDVALPSWWEPVADPGKVASAREKVLEILTSPRGASFRKDLDEAWSNFEEVSWLPAAFHLAARIWEGRWLMEQKRLARARSQPGVLEQLRLAAMLAPCLACTAHTLPRWMLPGGEEGWKAIDLLVLDEAGYTSAAEGCSALAFSKRAVVVGDQKQLPPVGITTAQDRRLLVKHGLLDLPESLRLSGGSSLAAAVAVTVLSRNSPPGIELVYHYRCRDEIIGFCNEFYYGGKLLPRRPRPEPPPPLPPLSYVFTDGRYDGRPSVVEDRRNVREAEEIALWLREEKDRLEAHYRQPLSQIVAIVTPFVNQQHEIERQLQKALGPEAMRDMLVGTVHKLQGTERPVVLFSTVVNAGWQSAWLAANDWLINVAVSRAIDSFVLFGAEATVFGHLARGPLARLGSYLARHGERLYPKELVVVEAPGKVSRVQAALGRRCLVVATGGHVREIASGRGFSPEAPWRETRPEVLERLASLAADLRPVVIATDDDREGEAIAWHVLDALAARGVALTAGEVRRMRFSSLDPAALRRAYRLAGPGLDMNRVRAALARDVADYLLGSTYSRLAKAPAGRVMTAVLAALAREEDRDRSRRLRVDVTLRDGRVFRGYVVAGPTPAAGPLDPEKAGDAARLVEALRSGAVADLGEKEILRLAPALSGPGTADVLALCARAGISPEAAMGCLEDLYLMGGEDL